MKPNVNVDSVRITPMQFNGSNQNRIDVRNENLFQRSENCVKCEADEDAPYQFPKCFFFYFHHYAYQHMPFHNHIWLKTFHIIVKKQNLHVRFKSISLNIVSVLSVNIFICIYRRWCCIFSNGSWILVETTDQSIFSDGRCKNVVVVWNSITGYCSSGTFLTIIIISRISITW